MTSRKIAKNCKNHESSDSAGSGKLPDAKVYGDEGSNTLVNLAKLGLGNIVQIKGIKPVSAPVGTFGKMAEKIRGEGYYYPDIGR